MIERVPNPYNAQWPDTIIDTVTGEVSEAVPVQRYVMPPSYFRKLAEVSPERAAEIERRFGVRPGMPA